MRIRAIAAIGLATAALLSVSACRVEQGAALFIGDERISQQRVDAIIEGIPADTRQRLSRLSAETGNRMSSISTGGLRGFVVDALATIELGERVAADTGREPDRSAIADAEEFWTNPLYGLDADSEFVDLAAEAEAYRPVLFEGAKPATASDAEIDATIDRFEYLSGDDYTAEERRAVRVELSGMLDAEQGRLMVGQRRQVTDYLEEYEVSANPRYGQAFILIGRTQGNSPIFVADIPD